MTENEKIERSSGQFVGGYRVGGGYRGLRDDQDEAVREFAHRLAGMFPHDVQIRYNTNRKGGGAWLGDDNRSAQVGLGAELKPPESHKEKVQAALDNGETLRGIERDYDTADMNLVYTVHLVAPAIDPAACDDHHSIHDAPYVHRRFDDLEAAWEWFTEHVERGGVRPPGE